MGKQTERLLCEVCGSDKGYGWPFQRVKRRRYADGLDHQFCRECAVKRQRSLELVQAEAYRKRKKTITARGHACELCGKQSGRLDQHHILPVASGGSNDDSNLQLLCVDCHKKQHKRRNWFK